MQKILDKVSPVELHRSGTPGIPGSSARIRAIRVLFAAVDEGIAVVQEFKSRPFAYAQDDRKGWLFNRRPVAPLERVFRSRR
jgi:hypothetical protein